MKKTIYHILAACTLTFTSSCGDFDINGDLDGMWHLRTVEDLSAHTTIPVKKQCIYYSVQQNLITVKSMTHIQYIGRFAHTDDSLILHSFRIFQNESQKAKPEELAPFYLDGTTSRYAVKKLDADEMVLSSDKRVLTFKKF